MKERPILSVYSYFICAICYCALIVCIYLILISFTSIIFPKYMNFNQLSIYKSLDTYRESNKNYKNLPDTELTKIKDRKYSDALYKIKGDSVESIIKRSIFLCISFVFLYIHWSLAQRRGLIDGEMKKKS